MNYNFLCHIIRDIFERKHNTVLYSEVNDSLLLREVMKSNEHSMESLVIHTDRSKREYFDGVA